MGQGLFARAEACQGTQFELPDDGAPAMRIRSDTRLNIDERLAELERVWAGLPVSYLGRNPVGDK